MDSECMTRRRNTSQRIDLQRCCIQETKIDEDWRRSPHLQDLLRQLRYLLSEIGYYPLKLLFRTICRFWLWHYKLDQRRDAKFVLLIQGLQRALLRTRTL